MSGCDLETQCMSRPRRWALASRRRRRCPPRASNGGASCSRSSSREWWTLACIQQRRLEFCARHAHASLQRLGGRDFSSAVTLVFMLLAVERNVEKRQRVPRRFGEGPTRLRCSAPHWMPPLAFHEAGLGRPGNGELTVHRPSHCV